MKVKQAIKSIAALGVGAGMLGMTMMGAMAADLSQYPSMFITNGQFNGVLVIGKNADAVDTIGMTNIALGLQAAAVTKTTVCSSGTSSTTTVDNSVQIDTSSTHFNLGTDLSDLKSSGLDNTDLSTVLADGVYNDNAGETKNKNVDFTQILDFTAGAGELVYAQDDDLAEKAAPYLLFPESTDAYTYQLEFDSPVEFSTTAGDQPDDIQTTTLQIQGQTYTVTEAKFDTDKLTKLTMMVGDTSTWMTQGQEIIKSVNGIEHSVKMTDVTEGADACGFQIDGTSVWIDNGDTDTIAGLTLGVIDAKAVHSELQDADICKVNFGASELVLEDGEPVNKDGSDVDGSMVYLTSEAGLYVVNEWSGLTISWAPDDDDIYLAAGDELVDPVFGNFKYVFGGLVESYNTVDVKASTSTGSITFLNTAGKEIEIPFALNDAKNGMVFGDGEGDDKQLYYNNTAAGVCTGAGDLEDCKGASWLLAFSKEAHVIEIDKIDMDKREITLTDLTTGKTSGAMTYTNNTNQMYAFTGGIGNVNITNNVAAGTIKLYVDELTKIESKDGKNKLKQFVSGVNNLTMQWQDNEGIGNTITTTIVADAVDDKIVINDPVLAGTGIKYEDMQFSSTDEDNKLYVTAYGSKVEYDSDAEDMMKISLETARVKGNVYVAPAGSALVTSTGAGSGCQVYETVNKIPSTVNKFDSDVTTPTAHNLITIGGPCANAVTSVLLGSPSVCYQGFESGKAMLKLVETGDKVALIIAGGTGDDTLRASTILQNYDQYPLTGKQMVATTVSKTGISVSSVTE